MGEVKIGNPAPLGLLAFGITTMMLMYVEMGWCEVRFQYMVAGTAMGLGGMGQVLVAIFELLKGSSFSFAVFGLYGFFWIGWALVYFEQQKSEEFTTFGDVVATDGRTLWFTQWGIVTVCFWIITWRKNRALITVFSLLWMTFFLLAIANAQESEEITKLAGYVGFATAVGALYTGVAELINEEYGRHLLPGLQPIYRPHRTEMTQEQISSLCDYDAKTNTLLLSFRGIQIKTLEQVQAVEAAVEASILNAKAPDGRVHVVADYQDAYISEDCMDAYLDMAKGLATKYYLSVSRFHVSSFGTPSVAPMTRRLGYIERPPNFVQQSPSQLTTKTINALECVRPPFPLSCEL